MGSDELKIWLNHFEYHVARAQKVPEGVGDVLKPAESRLIASSIAALERGAGASSPHLRSSHAAELERIFLLLLTEERHHASALRAFMQDHRISLKAPTLVIFRRLRRRRGLQQHLRAGLCTGLIGIVYYRALASVTRCERLNVLCRRIVADELASVAFQSQLLLSLRSEVAPPLKVAANLADRAMFLVAATRVWCTHGRVLRRAGYSAGAFIGACLEQYAFYLAGPRIDRAAHTTRI